MQYWEKLKIHSVYLYLQISEKTRMTHKAMRS